MKFPPENIYQKIYYYTSPGFWICALILVIAEIFKWFYCPKAVDATIEIIHDSLGLGIRADSNCLCKKSGVDIKGCPNISICYPNIKPDSCLCGAGGDEKCPHYKHCHPHEKNL